MTRQERVSSKDIVDYILYSRGVVKLPRSANQYTVYDFCVEGLTAEHFSAPKEHFPFHMIDDELTSGRAVILEQPAPYDIPVQQVHHAFFGHGEQDGVKAWFIWAFDIMRADMIMIITIAFSPSGVN